MRTRAKLVASPYQTAMGEWRAAVLVDGSKGVDFARVTDEHQTLKAGGTITVEKHGSEWRAV